MQGDSPVGKLGDPFHLVFRHDDRHAALGQAANNSEDLEWLYAISPFDWAFGEAPLANGMDWTGLALLWGGSAVLIAVATVGLARRDVLG